jgi:two-component system OmpR family response regulator
MRVLVAEDDEGLRSVLERGLRESGYAVDAVGDGELALRYLDTYEYEVAILDWRMPKVERPRSRPATASSRLCPSRPDADRT